MKKTSDVMRARNFEIYQRRKSGESYQSGKASAIPLQAYHCLYRQWLKSRSGEEDYPTIDFLLSLQDEQIRNMHRVGPAIYDYLLLIKQELVNN